MESSVFLIGFSTFLLGFIIGAAVIYFSQKKNEDVSTIKTKLTELQTKINERDGSFKTILDDIKNEKNKFSENKFLESNGKDMQWDFSLMRCRSRNKCYVKKKNSFLCFQFEYQFHLNCLYE
jgi:peptidoglycan hydrolase CwlO-like protein